MASFRLVACIPETHAAAVRDIFNEAIATSTALYDYQPRSEATIDAWFQAKAQGNYPVLGAVDDVGRLLGFASYGLFRAWPAYKYTLEHSLYVHPDARRQGVGRALLQALVAAATAQDYHVLMGGIDRDNAASIALHQRLGFVEVGLLPQVGFKFGRWLDLALYQLLLPTPAQPMDG